MTLIVALRCKDGVVIAADSQATFSQPGQPAKLPTQKVHSLGKHAGWGSAGDLGLQQKIADALNSHPTPGIWQNAIEEIRPKFKEAVLPIMKEALDDYIPGSEGLPKPIAHLVVAGYTKDRPWILEVDPNGTDTIHDEFGFCAVGSGGIFAHHALVDIRHHSVEDQDVFYGQVLAYRVVDGAIQCAAYNLGGPVQMWTVTANGIHQLEGAALREVADTVSLWKVAEVETLSTLLDPPAPTKE